MAHPWDKEKTLEATWWVLDREPGMDDIYEKAGKALDKMTEDLHVAMFQDRDGNNRLFLARFEFPKYEEDFTHKEAIFVKDPSTVQGFLDFLAGLPIDCIEMLLAIGEISSSAKKGEATDVKAGKGAVPPVPDKFFYWPEKDKILVNLTALPTKNVVKIMAPNLTGEPKPQKAHWWLRVNMTGKDKKFPVPGEFLGLGVRLFPTVPWGKQKSSPFLYAGNYMDTVYYSGARITEVIEPTDEVPYATYKVQWRKNEITAKPSDFAEYKVDDRVCILKDIATEKKTQLWKDDDMTKAGETWQIAPITFYGLGYQEE